MSQIFDYIFLKGKDSADVDTELITSNLEIEKHELVGETDLCQTGIVRNIFIGEINDGTIIFGNGITYKMIHDSKIRDNFLKGFDNCEVFSKSYDDRVMVFGFVLGINGEFICAKEGGDGIFSEGETTLFEEELRSIEEEVDEHVITYKLMEKFEKHYLGQQIEDFNCKEIKLMEYQRKQ